MKKTKATHYANTIDSALPSMENEEEGFPTIPRTLLLKRLEDQTGRLPASFPGSWANLVKIEKTVKYD